MNLTCTFSGHRPEKLPWGRDQSDPRCTALKITLYRELRALCLRGVLSYICGMARGADQLFLEALLELRKEFPLTVEAAVPCPSQADAWSPEEQTRYRALLGQCDRVTLVEDHYSPGCMLRRNRYMVDHADILVTVFDGSPGGTASTVAYAESRGLEILPIWR